MSASAMFGASNAFSEHLPTVTVNMLMDFLADYDVLVRPSASRRVFRWFEASEGAFAPHPHGLRSGQVLAVCRVSKALRILSSDASAFVCALSPDGSVPERTPDASDRLVVVRQKDTFSYFLFLVQRFFTDVMMWEDELDRIVLRKGGLHELLNVGNSALGDFMACVDESGNVLAHTEGVRPPSAAVARALADGCLPARVVRDAACDGRARLSRDVMVDGMRFATLLLVAQDPITPGTRDLFSLLFKRVEVLCADLWRTHVRLICPHHFFFARLTEGGVPDADYVAAHLRETAIPDPAQLKLVLFDLPHAPDAPPLVEVAAAAGRINHGECYCFVHKEGLCVLCYAPAGDSQLSHKKTEEDLERFVPASWGLAATSSQIFENVTDLDLAFRQAAIARNLRSVVEKEAQEGGMRAASAGSALIPFESCLLYYLVGAADKDERFLQFAFSHTLMQKISAEDAERGTDYLEIFWQYLSCERNATAVAERLHLHRNTVLYRIDKLEKRFDLDLSSRDVREKMLVDFKVFFLMQNRTSIRKLFEEAT